MNKIKLMLHPNLQSAKKINLSNSRRRYSRESSLVIFFQGNINPSCHCIVRFSGERERVRQRNGVADGTSRRRRIPCQSMSSESSSSDSSPPTDTNAADADDGLLLGDDINGPLTIGEFINLARFGF